MHLEPNFQTVDELEQAICVTLREDQNDIFLHVFRKIDEAQDGTYVKNIVTSMQFRLKFHHPAWSSVLSWFINKLTRTIMAARRTPASPIQKPKLELVISRDDAKAKLQERIEKGMILKQGRVETYEGYESLSNEYSKWDSFNSELLKQIFTTAEMADEYDHWGIAVMSMYEPSLGEKIADRFKGIDSKIHRLDSIIERLEIIPLSSAVQAAIPVLSTTTRTKRVFVVHGRDEIAKTNLEIFLHENGLEPVVLHRQADQGMTIIEKFEKHSDVGYAFILLTPDEIAYFSAEELKPDGERRKEFRARPNVIFEFGYFVGRLGRSRVCCLYTGDVALPSDVSGMIYKKYDKSIEEVAYSILKDLKASGYAIV